MTDRELIAAIASEIAPNPHFREDRRARLRKPADATSDNDFKAIRTARSKAARIVAKLREAGALA